MAENNPSRFALNKDPHQSQSAEAILETTPGQQSKGNLFVRASNWVLGTRQGKAVGVALLLALILSLYWWPESGFNEYQSKDNLDRLKTLWDWLGLLGVPVVLAVGGFLFSRAERKNELEIAAERDKQERAAADRRADKEREHAEARADLDRELADKRADKERERADNSLHQALCQDYLDRMSELLLDKQLASSKPDDLVREVARARTLTVLRGLGEDGARKGSIVQFLHETGLIKGKEPVVVLERADLRNADLGYIALDGAVLNGANLSGRQANLKRAFLRGADLRYTDLREADLSRALLISAILIGADLRGTRLRRADLKGANLSKAKVTNEQLSLALSLEGATMPDGSKYAGVPPTAGASLAISPDLPTPDSQDNAAT